jgi:CheY-like chemotaxis protein
MRVLIAEDEKKTRAILVEMVQSLGCEVLEAGTGYEAVKIVQESKPDVLLLDGLLPEMHGFEVARFVRERWSTMRHCDRHCGLQRPRRIRSSEAGSPQVDRHHRRHQRGRRARKRTGGGHLKSGRFPAI